MNIEEDEYPKGSKGTWPKDVQVLIRVAETGDDAAIKSLLQWGKCANWPGSGLSGGYLRTVPHRVYPLAVRVLQTNDDEWKYNVLGCLVADWPHDLLVKVTPILKELTRDPAGDEWRTNVAVQAARILCENKLLDHAELEAIVERITTNNPHVDWDDACDLHELLRKAKETG